MRRSAARHSLAAVILVACVGQGCRDPLYVPPEERRAIADSLTTLVQGAYDFSKPDAVARLLSLYPDSGRVISAAAGRVTATRAALATEIESFWTRVGRNMQGPRFELGSSYVDVVTRDAVVMTFAYRIPHRTPAGLEHVVSGAWTTYWRRTADGWKIVQEHLSDTPESTAPLTPAPVPADSLMHRH
jgi:ketosteroid isomerase-like protein/predicted small lipoprotein YifL